MKENFCNVRIISTEKQFNETLTISSLTKDVYLIVGNFMPEKV
jgi:hypothetical protein